MGENLRAGLAHARAGAQARDHPHRRDAAGDAGRSSSASRPTSKRCARCTRGSSCARCSSSSTAARGRRRRPRRTRRRRRGQPRVAGAPSAAGISDAAQTIAAAPRHYETITTEAQLDDWLTKLESAELFAFDTETTSLEYMKAEIVGVSFAVARRRRRLSAAARTTTPARPTSSIATRASRSLKPLLEIGAARQGRPPPQVRRARARATTASGCAGMRYDSMLESYVLEQRRDAPRHGLGARSAISAFAPFTTRTSPARARSRSRFSQVPVDKAAEYSAEDADVTLRLHQVLWPQIAAVPRAQDAL